MEPKKGAPRLAAKASFRRDAVRGKSILLYPEGVLVLNPTAEAILSLCDGRRTTDEIAATLAERYGGDPVAVRTDVWNFLGELAERGLLLFPQGHGGIDAD